MALGRNSRLTDQECTGCMQQERPFFCCPFGIVRTRLYYRYQQVRLGSDYSTRVFANRGNVSVLLTPSKTGYRPAPCTACGLAGCLASKSSQVMKTPVISSHFAFLPALPRVSKLFTSSVSCPVCSYPNDEDFRFCQQCGYVRHSRWRLYSLVWEEIQD